MKKIFTIIGLFALTSVHAQYFQWRFNLDYTTPQLRDERFNSGIVTRLNYIAGVPANFYHAGIGTSYNNTALPAPNNVADRMRFTTLGTIGAVLFSNLGYEFSDPGATPFHSSGNGIAEIDDGAGTGGYVTVGAVANNSTTAAAGIAGNSDALIAQLTTGGGVVASTRIDINGGKDVAWCIRKSAVLVGGFPTWIVCGESKKGANYTDCFVARVLANGTIVWCFRYNFDPTPSATGFNTAHCVAKQLCEDAAGNIYAVGTLIDNPVAAWGTDGLAFKLTPAGAVVWARNYHLFTDDEFQAVRLSFDGNIVIGGFTNFAAAAPVTHHMLIIKLTAAAGAPMFQNVLPAVDAAGTVYTSRAYDIIEVLGVGGLAVQYYLAGPVLKGNQVSQMMHRANGAGISINWYKYNRMKYDVGFGIDYENASATPGISYFSSFRNKSVAPVVSDGHIMKLDFLGRTCKFCGNNPPNNVNIQMQVFTRQWQQWQDGIQKQLIPTVFKYDNKQICNDAVIACPAPPAAPSAAKSIIAAEKGIKIYPNPVNNILHLQFNAIPAGEYIITLANMDGKIILQKNNTISGNTSFTDIDMSKTARGVYLLTLKRGDYTLQQKVVKQ